MTALVTALLSASGCLPVADDQIRASHLAARVPALTDLPATAVFGFAPRFGVRRTILGVELAAFAQRQGLSIAVPGDVCVVRPWALLDAGAVRAAMERALPEAALRLLDYLKQPVPLGNVEFPRLGLGINGLWRGYVKGGDGRRYPVWAKVDVHIDRQTAVAGRDLTPGEILKPEDIRLERVPQHPSATATPESLDDLVGMTVRRPVRTGTPLVTALLVKPREVAAGDKVSVTVEAGQAKLSLEAQAETGGRRGDRIVLKNLTSGKRFRGVVAGPGQVKVEGDDGTN
ncbi:MAG: flagellar basal body P-ring formation chaperone FlgA [Acidobacteria bacterium]|nr:flagellar basal body P-ring formation chaperone FlgA [Acidobacteriota bacterium]